MINKLEPIGAGEVSEQAGYGINKRVISQYVVFLLFSVAPWADAAEGDIVLDWNTPSEWPFIFHYTANGNTPELLVIEESGINLRLEDRRGKTTNTPGKRINGPEFFVVDAGADIELGIMPVYGNSPPGSFRIIRMPLIDEALLRAARTLNQAGFDAASTDRARVEQACASYLSVSLEEDLPPHITAASAMIAVNCHRLAGIAIEDDLLQRLDTSDSPLGFKPYHADWLRGELAFRNEENGDALVLFNRALEQANNEFATDAKQGLGQELDIAALHVSRASANMLQAWLSGNDQSATLLDSAEQDLLFAIDIAAKKGDHILNGSAHDFLAAVEYVRGNDSAVIKNLLIARDEIILTNQPQELIVVLGSIGDYYKRWGDLQAAQEAYLEAIRIVKETSSEHRAADTFHNMSSLYLMLGDLPRAKEMIQQAEAVYRNAGNIFRANIMDYDLAGILEREGLLQQAHDKLDKLLTFLLEQPDPWDPIRITTQSALARVENQLNHFTSALEYSTEVIEHLESRAVPNGFQIVPVYITHAELLAANGDSRGALELLEQTLATTAVEPANKIEVLAGMLAIYQDLGDTERAIATAKRSFDLIESQYMEIESVRLGPYWNGRTQKVYISHAEYLLGLSETDDSYLQRAFRVVEQARATSLRLRRQEVLLARSKSNSEAQDEWRNILASIQQSAGIQEDERDTLKLERRISEAREQFFVRYTDSSLRLKPDLITLSQVRADLDKNTLLLEYLAGPRFIWRFDITSNGWTIKKVGPTEMVSASVDAALYELTRGPDVTPKNINLLSSLLLKDLNIGDGISKILVSPSTSLNSIPFAAIKYRGTYLSDFTTVAIVPSISEYFSSPQVSDLPEDRLSLAVFADPAFGRFVKTDVEATGSDRLRSWSDSLERLPASALEAKALSQFYNDDESLVLTGAEATQQKLFDDQVRNAKIIHIATHGYFNENLPELIGFAMASGDEFDDGFVSISEIATQQFNSDLVVISACSTARGEVIPGEGNMSLARTFLAQGVNSVVSTLWPVSDRATATFMKEFYRAINREDLTYDEALRRAQLVLKQSQHYHSPFYWGAYVLTSVSKFN